MGCGTSAVAVSQSRPQVKAHASLKVELIPGEAAIIRNSPNPHLNGQRVICEEYNASLGEWLVKGDKFPLTVGMSLGAQFLDPIGSQCASFNGSDVRAQLQSSDSLQLAPTLLSSRSSGAKLVPGKFQDLLRTTLEEKCEALMPGRSCSGQRMFDCSKEDVGEIVNDVREHANRIIQRGSGLGAASDCPFASADEVHLYYQFCLKVLNKWSDHELDQDDQMDNAFFSQINDLCEILACLDTDAVPLPQEVGNNIQLIQREELFPNWVRGHIRNAESAERDAAVTRCLVIGRKWHLEEADAFQMALASLESNN